MTNATIAANLVTETPAAAPDAAAAHFQRLLTYETDCWDVHQVLGRPHPGFVLLDVRSPEAYAAGHVPGTKAPPTIMPAISSATMRPSSIVFQSREARPAAQMARAAAASSTAT